jgi:hypothetical protein
MSLGLSIFLSAVLLGIIALYIATRDRWNWKKIILWPVSVLLAVSLSIGLYLYVKSLIESRPHVQASFWGLSLDTTKDDVTFVKGKPTKVQDGDRWIYEEKESSSERVDSYTVQFRDEKVRFVAYAGDTSWKADLQGYWLHASSERIVEKFGNPSDVSKSEDSLNRIFSYSKYNIFFILEKNQVVVCGLYNPTFGPIKFVDKEKESKG